MTNVPDAAIEAAAVSTHKHVVHLVHPPHVYKTICACGWNGSGLYDNQFDAYSEHIRHLAQVAIEAAMPAIREAIAQEIEALHPRCTEECPMCETYDHAIAIVRGGAE